MTSQNMDIDALKAEAKELGVKGWHVTNDPEKLQAKIEAKKAEVVVSEEPAKPVRKKAPKMSVRKAGVSRRNDLIAKLKAEDPDSEYLTQSANLTAAEAEAKGFEIVTNKSTGGYLYCGDDIVVRTDKNSFSEWQNERTADSLRSMKSIDKDLTHERGGRKIQALTEQVKQGFTPASE